MLKFPDNEFTIAELGELNDKSASGVYPEFKKKLDAGALVCCGSREGVRKPSKLFKLASEISIPHTAENSEVKTKVQNYLEGKKSEPVAPKIIEEQKSQVIGRSVLRQVEENLVCPVCGEKLFSTIDSSGIWLECRQDYKHHEKFGCHESPHAHTQTTKVNEAYIILMQKYGNGK